MSNSKTIVVSLLCLWFLKSSSQEVSPQPFEYPFEVSVYDLPLSSNGVHYRLYIRSPLRKPLPDQKCAVFYFLDPIRLFTPAAAMTSNYEYFNYIPAAYYVGIGYQNEKDGYPKELNRTRDYTPTSFTPPDSTHYLASNPVDYEGSGGTDAFLKVLEEEIIPFIENRFEVNPDERVLIGKSMSGLAAVHIVLTKPKLFSRYIIVSPAIWWDDWLYQRRDRYVMKQVSKINSKMYDQETRVYFAIGEAEERLGLVTDLYVLTNAIRMKRISNFKVHLDVLQGEQHEGVFPSAFMKGIVGIYAEEENRKTSASPVRWK